MLRPLDESLIDFQKTYRQIFKQPLFEHQQYTKRQLIYNYAEIGSEFINELMTKKDHQVEVDLAEIIKQWNDKGVTVEQMIKYKNEENKTITKSKQEKPLPQYDQQDKAFIKQIQIVKKDKLITKSRTQRNVNYRKQLEILFKTRNINMLNVQTMKNHFNQLKPYNHYHSKNKLKKYQDNYQQKSWTDKYGTDRDKQEIDRDKYATERDKYETERDKYETERDKYEIERDKYGGEKAKYEHGEKYSQDEENVQENYERTISGKRETQSINYKTLSERYAKDIQKSQYVLKREEATTFQVYERESNISPRYKPQSQYQFRPPTYFPPPIQQPYSTASQYDISTQYPRAVPEQVYKKYLPHEQGSGHNQFYQQNFPKPLQSQTNTSSNNSYFNYESSYRGTFAGNKSDIKGQYRAQ